MTNIGLFFSLIRWILNIGFPKEISNSNKANQMILSYFLK